MHSTNPLDQMMMELYEKEDYQGIIDCTLKLDRYHLTDTQLLLIAASYYHLGRKDIGYFKAGIAYLLPLDHGSLNAYSQWHYYMGMSLHSICNYARAFQHFHEFLALSDPSKDQHSQQRYLDVEQKIKSCQAFLTLPFFNHTFADRVKHFWQEFDSLVPVFSLYVDKLNHVKSEHKHTRSTSLHGSQKKYTESLEHLKKILGSLLPGQKFTIRFFTKEQAPARFEIILPVGRFIARMHALKFFVSQKDIFCSNKDQFICTLGVPTREDYECNLGGYHVTSQDVNVFIRVDDMGCWHEEISRQIILYSSKLSDCPEVLRGHILTQLLYHKSGELAIHTYFDDISVIDDHDNEQMMCLIANDKLLNTEHVQQSIAVCEAQASDSSTSEQCNMAMNCKVQQAFKNKQRTHAYEIDEHASCALNSSNHQDHDNAEQAPCFCKGNASCLVVRNDTHYLQIPLNKLNLYLMSQGLAVDNINFDEYWLTNGMEIFSQDLFVTAPGSNSQEHEDLDEAIALRLESFWSQTNCYELEDYMSSLDQSSSISCYDWGIMPCFLIIPLRNFTLPENCFNSDLTINEDKLEEIKQLVLDYKSSLIKRLIIHCKDQTFSCTGVALSHEFVFIDFMLWQPFCALAGLHEIIVNDGFEDVGLKSFHPFTNEMAVEHLDLTLSQAQCS